MIINAETTYTNMYKWFVLPLSDLYEPFSRGKMIHVNNILRTPVFKESGAGMVF